jgi:hypothetical protein
LGAVSGGSFWPPFALRTGVRFGGLWRLIIWRLFLLWLGLGRPGVPPLPIPTPASPAHPSLAAPNECSQFGPKSAPPQALRPHVFVSVPRLWNRIYDRVTAGVAAGGPVTRALFWRVRGGHRASPGGGITGEGRWGLQRGIASSAFERFRSPRKRASAATTSVTPWPQHPPHSKRSSQKAPPHKTLFPPPPRRTPPSGRPWRGGTPAAGGGRRCGTGWSFQRSGPSSGGR